MTQALKPPARPAAWSGSPQELIAGLQQRDVRAFRVIYELYRARLHSFLGRLTGDEQLARDLGQETWLRLAANAQRLRPDTDPGAWLFTVARNLYRSHQRWRFLSRARLRELQLWAAPTRQLSPFDVVDAQQSEQSLERALAALPLPYREVVLLVCVEGFATLEVARMLDVEHATVRQRLSRARTRLKKAILPEETR